MYSLEDIFPTYSIKLNFSNQVLEFNGNKFNLNLITDYEISVRMCELKNVNQILTGKSKNFSETRKYRELMLHIKNSKCSLAKIICNNAFINEFTNDDTLLCVFLKKLNEFLNSRKVGYKTLLYLLSSLRNNIVKKQISQTKSPNLSNLFLRDNPCLHFEKVPYLYNLINHVTKYSYLVDVFDDDEYKPQMVARYIRSLSIINNRLFIPLSLSLNNFTLLKEIDDFNKQIEKMGEHYNSKFRIEITNDKKYCYYLKYFEYTKKSLNCLFNLMKKQDQINVDWSKGVVKNTIRKNEDLFDDEQKNQIIEKMFSKYSLYSVYGVAGSGKTKLIINTLKVFDNESFKILCLSNTNVAVNNIKMRHKNSSHNITFETIYKFNHKSWNGEKYDFLVLDECSNIPTRDMLNVLEKIEMYGIKKILLAGDILQLESIDFGGWFEIWKYFLKTNEEFKDSYTNLTTTWRARKNEELKNFWKVIREHDRDSIVTSIYNNGVGVALDNVLNNSPTYDDTIFLCLNYSGRYGINSINDILQQKNTNQQIEWGKKLYKKGDPIIFDNVNINYYNNILFNNLRGNIQNIECPPDKDFIKFTIILDIDDFDLGQRESIKQIRNLKYIKEENSKPVIELKINALSDDAYDDDSLEEPNNIVPFHVAYAISIHKSQGLEYKNVNIVISDYVVDNISFNIFYTAITRASEKIKIYWSDKTQKEIIDLLSVKDNSYVWIDFNLIKNLLSKYKK